MPDGNVIAEFPKLNRGYNSVFRPDALSIGFGRPSGGSPSQRGSRHVSSYGKSATGGQTRLRSTLVKGRSV